MAEAFEHTIYDNFFLANEVEDQMKSHLDLTRFATVDTTLQGVAGMKKIIHKYKATDGTEKLKMGVGNTKSISVSFTDEEYEIELAQNRFEYYDEQAMIDPMLVPVGVRHTATDMYNTMNDDIFNEFNKTTVEVEYEQLNFDAFVDAAAAMNLENIEGVTKFAFVCPLDVAKIRKNCKDTYQYVTAYATNGYVGTLGDINLYTKKDAKPGEVIVATKEAVTLFVKTGTQIEQASFNTRSEDNMNVRKNTVITRKYYVVALTDESKAIKLVPASTDDSE